jgi:glutamate-1-semialdehyde aminotransferase
MRGTGVDLERVRHIEQEEQQRFVAERPRSAALRERARRSMPGGVPTTWVGSLNFPHPPVWVTEAHGARFRDVDDHEYIDFLLGICLAFCGHAPPAVVEAVTGRAARGSMFQQPTEDALWVAEELSRLFPRVRWQFALSSSQSIQDCIRLARATTGRERLLKFDANYHGHLDSTLVVATGQGVAPEYHGTDPRVLETTEVIPFNDVNALERALSPRDVALVIAEPAMTNIGLIEPIPGFHDALRALTRDAGTLLLIDETQTLMSAYGGLSNEYRLQPDMFVLGKSLGGGIVPFSAYGIAEEVAALIEAPHAAFEVSGEPVDEIALGGTMWSYALGAAAARAALTHVLTRKAYERTIALGERLADGLTRAIANVDLPWTVQRLGTRAAYTTAPIVPRDAAEARAADVPGFKDAQRVFMANRGIWDFGWWGGPCLSVAHTAADVDAYVDRFGQWLATVLG